MNVVELVWNTIETHREAACFFFALPSPCADGERGCFREAEVENEPDEDGVMVANSSINGNDQPHGT